MVIQRIKEIRESHGHTQEYVNHNTGLGIAHFESGLRFPTLDSILVFCRFYNFTLDEFFAPMAYPPKK